jgi:hypothetical protein
MDHPEGGGAWIGDAVVCVSVCLQTYIKFQHLLGYVIFYKKDVSGVIFALDFWREVTYNIS